MGLFSSIGNFLTSNPVGKVITNTLDTVSGVFTNPITAATKGVGAAKQEFLNASPVTNAVKTVATTVVAAGAIVAAGAAAGSATAIGIGSKVLSAGSKVVKAVAPTTVKGALVQAAVVPVVATAVIKNPTGAVNTVGKVVSAQVDLGSLIADPSKDKLMSYVKDHPVATGVLAAGGVIATGAGIGTAANILSNYQNTKAVKENTAANLSGNSEIPVDTSSSQMPKVIQEVPSGTFQAQPVATNSGPIPQTPQTSKISSGTKTRRRKPRKAPQSNISQRVNVIVSNKSSSTGIANKRYLNREVLAF